MAQLDTRTDTQQTASEPRPAARRNRLAVWGLVLAVLTLGGVGSVLGIVFGVKARSQVRETGEPGAGLAVASILVGFVTLLVAIAYWIVIAQHFGGSSGGTGGGGGGSGY